MLAGRVPVRVRMVMVWVVWDRMAEMMAGPRLPVAPAIAMVSCIVDVGVGVGVGACGLC